MYDDQWSRCADDVLQIEAAISRCGHYGTTTINEGVYNITRCELPALAHVEAEHICAGR